MKQRAARTVTLGLIQTACAADPAVNLKKTLALAERAARKGTQIICTLPVAIFLPERGL